jgi:SAM-dependent methyltransferase
MKASDFQKLFSVDGVGTPDEATGPRVEKVRRIFAESNAKTILDIGCANGAILKPLLGTRELHGVDISEVLVQKANAIGMKALVHDVESGPLPYSNGTFDAVFCGETIEHQVDTDWLLSEINRVLKPGGVIVLTFPNIRTVLSLLMMTFFDIPPMYAARYRASHVRDFTLKTIKMALDKNGFTFRQAVGTAFYFPKIGEFGKGLAEWFPSWSHTSVVVAAKHRDAVYPPPDLTGKIY